MIGVTTQLAAYRVAVAELPSRLRLRERDVQIVVVSADAAGVASAARAIEEGAQAIVVDRPGVGTGDLVALRDTGAPIVLARAGLRDDVARDARTPGAGADAAPRAVTVQTLAARGALGDALLDAIGWGRTLTGGEITLRSAHGTADAALADLVGGSGVGVGVIASERLGAGGSARLRATAIGAHRVDVVSVGARVTVSRSTPAGELVLPRRWESPERLAVRRAIGVLTEGTAPSDVDEWTHDLALVRRIMTAARTEHQRK